jgi:histone-binding protein RBBP4
VTYFVYIVENSDEIEQQKIMEEYKIWKKNSPFFYDTMYSHALQWPSLTVEWMPNRDVPYGSDHTIQKLLIGTHASNDE